MAKTRIRKPNSQDGPSAGRGASSPGRVVKGSGRGGGKGISGEDIGRDRDTLTAQHGPQGSEGAAARAADAIGVQPPSRMPLLPFESTLAYVFRLVGGKLTAIEAARLLAVDDERFKKFVYAYDSLSATDKNNIRIEDLCQAAEITQEEFLGLVIPALWRRNVDIAKLVSAMNLPRVIEASSERALGMFGMPDAKMIFDMHNLLPTSKGVNISIDNSKKSVHVGKGVDLGSSPGLPTFEASVVSTTAAIRGDAGTGSVGRKLLTGVEESQIIDAEVEEMEPVHVQPRTDSQEG